MKATVLIDNISKNELIKEWGLSIFIEYENHKILLDTGASGIFLRNAEKLGIDIREVELGVLSHAHYDHANGMEAFFKNNPTAKFILRQGASENCYSQHFLYKKYIGIRKGTLKKYADRISFAQGDQEILPGGFLIPHTPQGLVEKGEKTKMYRKTGWRMFPDDFSHEQSLVLKTTEGLIVFNSCSHGGADTIIKEVADTFPEEKMHALIGGFHLYKETESEIYSLAKSIRDTGIDVVYTGHCTGMRAYHILEKELPGKVHLLHTGYEMKFR